MGHRQDTDWICMFQSHLPISTMEKARHFPAKAARAVVEALGKVALLQLRVRAPSLSYVQDTNGQEQFSLVETLRDLQLVVDWVHSQIPPAGGDADQVYLLGAGAGAHLCSLYNLGCALGSQYAQACKQMGRSTIPILSSPEADRMLKIWCTSLRNPPRPVLGLILISGVFDLMFQKRYEDERCLSGLAMTSYLFDSRAKAEAWSPQVILDSLKRRNFVLDISKMAKRALFIHGRKDATFPFLSSHRFFRSLCNWDVPDVNMKVYANLRRIDPTVALLSPKAPLTQSLLEDIRGIILDLDQEKGEEGSP
ncbi:hypothetical protein H4219_001023 [Mycoemilia scoparia]|uniref:Uncharacterized protein n=1 Tax=Mycoemilia scoparia TaxID=417184 RepID=A0A9W8DSF0_9FUNG|nr:hypothetical protein H4219_001023 [Mycoemilia scoparia]